MGKGKRVEKKIAARPRESATEVADSFRKASKALEAVSRDVAALRHRLTRSVSR